ncbi:2-amino-4-hydroxy-6-hydroxymethyldihydropteridine diphosphokinase [Varunaivibrio sulfuroxidans]|uniref:2-amino-4-hydroxy-6-hydroxymethyldihydropteridine pyrophosphokinase n=1 Tax=Varunaivibrio sulfuroxidans TaxID=1773489 RepID=A0A4R3JEB6_9PROT|nr:2-amino-4-hydroxy-6-hydroxymethyldihydropteridine diphosphokinase [Varunaivibrio sulfuroxidans]
MVRVAPWYRSAPVPASDQPWYVNSVAEIATNLAPRAVLDALHRVEADFGRVRTVRNAPRTVDIDLLCYDDYLSKRAVRDVFRDSPQAGGADEEIVPHPHMHERAFVLLPLRDLAPAWRHPRSGATISALIAKLPKDQIIAAMDG